MKLLLINPNTSAFVTERMLAAARATLGGSVLVEGVTARSGPAIIGSRTENALAASGALELAAQHGAGFDAVILGVSTDTGLAPLRELLAVPVSGMLEAALLTASQLGGRIGLLTLGPRMLPLYQEQAAAYGLADRVVAWAAPELPAAYGQAPGAQVFDAVADHAARLVQDHDLDVLVASGAVLAGCRPHIQDRVPVPVVDAMEAAAWQALALASLRPVQQRVGSYAPPRGRQLSGVPQALVDRLA